MILRSYQQRSLDRLRASYASGKRAPLLQLPTGAGKTVVASEIIRLTTARNRRVLFGVGRSELREQSERKLADAGVTGVRVIQADRDDGPKDALVTVASIPTLVTDRWRDQLPPCDLFIIDEAHHVMAETWARLASAYSGSLLLGLSALPQRGDGRGLGNMFDDLVVGATIRELVDLGHLAQSRVYGPDRVLLPRELALDPVDAFERYALEPRRERAIVFAQTRAHAKAIAESFTRRGYTSEAVDGLTSDRSDVLARFARSEIQVLSSVAVLVEGFDDPGVSVAILAKRFTHVGSYIQAGGRILRPHPAKQRATLIDLCGSSLVHGPLDIDRALSLDGEGVAKLKRGCVRRCGACGGVYIADGRDACLFCGYALPALSRAKPKSLSEQLHEVTKDFEPRAWNVRHATKQRLCSYCGRSIDLRAKYVYVDRGPSYHPSCAFAMARSRSKEAA